MHYEGIYDFAENNPAEGGVQPFVEIEFALLILSNSVRPISLQSTNYCTCSHGLLIIALYCSRLAMEFLLLSTTIPVWTVVRVVLKQVTGEKYYYTCSTCSTKVLEHSSSPFQARLRFRPGFLPFLQIPPSHCFLEERPLEKTLSARYMYVPSNNYLKCACEH